MQIGIRGPPERHCPASLIAACAPTGPVETLWWPGSAELARSPLVSVDEVIATERSPLPLLRSSFLELDGLYELWDAAPAPGPELVVFNEPLAIELGIDPDEVRSPRGVAALAGHGLGADVATSAQAYAGHQFGGFVPSLGDGRALLLGELVDGEGRRRDLHLKGSGPTPFSRGGDGRAALGPMLREYLVSEAMHALDIPTTRALAVVTTGEQVSRDGVQRGAVLARIAASHLRVGTFQYAAVHGDMDRLRRLADHAITRHHPQAAEADQPYVALFDAVAEAQASLVARWMLVGFVHGVMNTDNTTISGETIDYGPCAFMDAYDPATVFSSIDHGGRYAYGNQPRDHALEPGPPRRDAAATVRHRPPSRCRRCQLGAADLLGPVPTTLARRDAGQVGPARGGSDDGRLVDDLLNLLQAQQVDFVSSMRSLSAAVLGDPSSARALFGEPAAIRYVGRALASAACRRRPFRHDRRRGDEPGQPDLHPAQPRRGSCTFRRHPAGELAPFAELLNVVTRPFEARAGLDAYRRPAPGGAGRYLTFCGT